MDAGLKRELEAKVYAGERLTREDGIALYESDDLAWLGRLAHHKRTEMNGDRALFSVNRLVDLAAAGDLATDEHLTELHIVNAVHSDRAWHSYPETLRAIKAARPGAGLVGFGASDIRALERSSGLPAGEILDELVSAGLDSLTDDGTPIFDPDVRSRLTGDDLGWDDWSRIHRLAHDKGLKTPAAMLYGHIEEPRHRVDHVVRLRELQDETGGFAVFVPLRSMDGDAAAPAGSLKIFAVSRLLFDNVPHVQASGAAHGPSVAQLALNFGADELDIAEAGDTTTNDDDRLNLIWDAGFRPALRDSRYAVVREYDPAPTFTERRSEPQQVWA